MQTTTTIVEVICVTKMTHLTLTMLSTIGLIALFILCLSSLVRFLNDK